MQAMLIALASILAITGAVWAVRRSLGVRACPICLGVGGTWLWMLAARELGVRVDPTTLAVLLGGSVVALAQLVERRLPAARSPLVWKTLFIPPGFVVAYALVGRQWALAAGVALALAALAAWFVAAPRPHGRDEAQIDALVDRMKNCC